MVRVRACALNHLDLWQRRGIDARAHPASHISGSDVAGRVVDAGGGSRTGTRVMLHPGLSCGSCRRMQQGRDNLCPRTTCWAARTAGTRSWFRCRREPDSHSRSRRLRRSGRVSADVPDRVAHARDRRRVREGDDVLVLAGGSGVGQAAIQIARLHGARVFATSAPRRPNGRWRSARRSLRSLHGRFRQGHAPLTGGRGVDIVVEHVGEATWDRSVRALASGGRLVTCGATTGAGRRSICGTSSRVSCRCLVPTWAPARSSSRRPHFFAGRLAPVVDEVLPLTDAAAAHARLEGRSSSERSS